MKKLLALVLALVMTLGLATVGTNADYSDADDISLEEAVDVMSAVGVFQGSDGKFSPKENLTREQAAKLIAYLDLGEAAAEALPGLKVFDDVEASRWSAKYIAYCQDAGYIAGVGNGKFNPTGELSGYAFGKMVLCVLGYDAELENFTGNNWTLNVAKLMEKNDIADGIDGAASATLTREQAAQYCLNALQADMVEYDTKGTSIEINGAKIATGASKAEAVKTNNDTNAIAADGVVQLGEKLYKGDLVLNNNDKDEFNAPATSWSYKAKDIGTYAKAADQVLTGGVKFGALYTAIGSTAVSNMSATHKDVYVDGYKVSADASAYAKKNDTDNSMTWTGNGTKTEVYVTYNAAYDVDVIITRTYLAKVTSVTAASGANDRKVTVTLKSAAPNEPAGTGVDYTYETDSFAKNDYVLVTFAYNTNNNKYEIASMTAAPAPVSAKVTSYKSGDNFVADGTTYKYSKMKYNTVSSVGDTIDIYCDADGFVLFSETTSASTDLSKYLVLYADASESTLNSTTIVANAMTLDGTLLKGIKLGKLNNTAITATHGNSNSANLKQIYAYTVNSNDEYDLKTINANPYSAYTTADDTIDYTAGDTKLTAGTTKFVVNNSTQFVVLSADQKSVKVYNGVANVPALVSAYAAVLYDTNFAAKVVAVTSAATVTATSSSDKLVYVLSNKLTTSESGSDTISTYDVIIDSAVTTASYKNSEVSLGNGQGLYRVEFSGDYMSNVPANFTTAGTSTAISDLNSYVTVIDATVSKANVTFEDGVFSIYKIGVDTYNFLADTDVTAWTISSSGTATQTTLNGLVEDNAAYKYTVVTKKNGNNYFVETVYAQKAN